MKNNSKNIMQEHLENISKLCCKECKAMIKEKTQALEEKYPQLETAGVIKQAKAGREAMKIGKGVCKQCKRKIKKNYK